MDVFYKNSSGKNFDAAGVHRDTYRTYVVNPSLTFDKIHSPKSIQSNSKSVSIHHPSGEVSEWLKELAWKAAN